MKNVTLHFPRRCHTDNRRYHNTRSSGGPCTVEMRASRISGLVYPSLSCQIFIPLSARNRILPKKSILSQLISVTRKFITMFLTACECPPILRQGNANSNLHITSWSFLVLSFHLRLFYQSGQPSSCVLTKTLYVFLFCHACHTPSPFQCPWLDNYNNN